MADTERVANGRGRESNLRSNSTIEWLALAPMRVSPISQRTYRQSRVDYLVANMDLDKLGKLVVNLRDGIYWVVDGQHRRGALLELEYTHAECELFIGLTTKQEAELWLGRDNQLKSQPIEMFSQAVVAERDIEVAIMQIVSSEGWRIGRSQDGPEVAAIGALERAYGYDPDILRQTMRMIRDAYGWRGAQAHVINGLALVCNVYRGQFDENHAIATLKSQPGGMNAMLGRAGELRRQMGRSMSQCTAAAIVEVLNRRLGGPNGRKLKPWWKIDTNAKRQRDDD